MCGGDGVLGVGVLERMIELGKDAIKSLTQIVSKQGGGRGRYRQSEISLHLRTAFQVRSRKTCEPGKCPMYQIYQTYQMYQMLFPHPIISEDKSGPSRKDHEA